MDVFWKIIIFFVSTAFRNDKKAKLCFFINIKKSLEASFLFHFYFCNFRLYMTLTCKYTLSITNCGFLLI